MADPISSLAEKLQLKSKLGLTVESVLAAALALDPASAATLSTLEGKRVALQFTQPALNIRMQVKNAALVFDDSAPDIDADLTLKTTPGAMLGLVVGRLSGDSHIIGKVHIAGDAELAQNLQKWLSRFDPDWDELFSRGFGDVLGFQLARGARNFTSWFGRSAKQFAATSADYLQDESKAVASRVELEQWYESVDDLRDGTERASRRIDALISKSVRTKT
jgi:ubiquinone biosynthesis accessory factor UbiJ